MSKQARITSVESLDRFRAAVREFQLSAMRALGSIHQDVQRMQSWVNSEQPPVWRIRIRKIEAEVNNARSDLERARISRPDDSPRMFIDMQKALEKARRKQEEALTRIRLLKKWSRRIEHESMLLRAGTQSLSSLLEVDMTQLSSKLKVLSRHLEAYLRLPTPPRDFDAWAREVEPSMPDLSRSGESTDSEQPPDTESENNAGESTP
ncbi:MAG: hypothetical protein VX527_07930 [Planctomycetota bacterium]|nr:hypothetical protein [Planctomycetota bacterium]